MYMTEKAKLQPQHHTFPTLGSISAGKGRRHAGDSAFESPDVPLEDSNIT